MHSKTFAALVLSASTVIASPFHMRRDWHHHRHGTSSFSLKPTGTGAGFRDQNSTGVFAATETVSAVQFSQFLTQTVSPLPQSTEADPKVDASSSVTCVSSSLSTETSISLVTVTASGGDAAATLVATGSVNPGAFYGGGGRSWSWGGNGGQSTTSAVPAPSAPAFSASNAATTLVPVPSAARSSAVASASALSVPASSGSSGGKRGISFNDASLVAAFGSSVSWSYNWASSESGSLGGVEFVPMIGNKINWTISTASFEECIKPIDTHEWVCASAIGDCWRPDLDFANKTRQRLFMQFSSSSGIDV